MMRYILLISYVASFPDITVDRLKLPCLKVCSEWVKKGEYNNVGVQVDKEVMILTSYETAMRTAHNFLAVFLAKWVLPYTMYRYYRTQCTGPKSELNFIALTNSDLLELLVSAIMHLAYAGWPQILKSPLSIFFRTWKVLENRMGPWKFLARDSMLSALYAIANPSVCHTGGSVENGWS